MASRKELRAAIAEARGKTQRAIVESAGGWETPGPGDEGEEAWSPRQAIEHATGAEVFFASRISTTCGYPALEMKTYSLASAAEAAEEYALACAKADSILQHVSDEDLQRKVEEGRLGGMTVEAIMALTASHASEHAEQAIAVAR